MAEGYEHTDQREHYFWLEESNMIGMEVGNEEYAMLCPHCSPSYFLYKPGIKKSEICHNANSDLCEKCQEPECELSGQPCKETPSQEKS